MKLNPLCRWGSPAILLSLLLSAALLVALALPALAEKAQEADPQADQAARAWLALIDQGKYATAWEQAGELLRKNISKADWEKRLSAVAAKTGPALEHKLLRSQVLDNPPGNPPGSYLILIYAPMYPKAPTLLQQVALSQDAKKQWKVVGYYLR